MRNVQYLMDQHVISSGEASYTRLCKYWVPGRGLPLILDNGVPVGSMPQLWHVWHVEAALVHSDGKAATGWRCYVVDNGPPGQGAITMGGDIQGTGQPSLMRWPQPVLYGIGWLLNKPLTAGDVLIFRAKYEVVK